MISLVTTCMGRRKHLELTLFGNVQRALASMREVEILILDYSSKDGLGDWLKSNYGVHIGSLITYLRLDGKEHYDSPHAKNVAHLAARGDILVNIDADALLGAGFIGWLDHQFVTHEKIHLRAKVGFGKGGRIAVRKEDFLAVGGYDETFGDGYGCDDGDFSDRLEAHGIQKVLIPKEFCDQIGHSPLLRVENMRRKDQVRSNMDHARISKKNIARRKLEANTGRIWGEADLTENFVKSRRTGVDAR